MLLAFPLALVTFGLGRRRRVAWMAALVAVPPSTLFPLVTGRATEIPLFFAVLAAVPLLVANRGEFDTAPALSLLQIASLTSILGVVLHGTVGAYAVNFVPMSLFSAGAWATQWTVWNWAWWFSWAPFAERFIAAPSRGCRIRTVVFTSVVAIAAATGAWSHPPREHRPLGRIPGRGRPRGVARRRR